MNLSLKFDVRYCVALSSYRFVDNSIGDIFSSKAFLYTITGRIYPQQLQHPQNAPTFLSARVKDLTYFVS